MNPYSLAVCEDDRTIRETVCRFCDEILEEAGIPHEVTAFSRVEEAEAALAAKKQIHLLILDIETGGKTGVELAQELRDRDDERSILFITGYEKYLPVAGDGRVSKVHCVIIHRGDKLYLKDEGSRNGTYLNGERLEGPVVIQRDDIIGVGETRFEIQRILRESE